MRQVVVLNCARSPALGTRDAARGKWHVSVLCCCGPRTGATTTAAVLEAGVKRQAVIEAERLLGTAIWGAARQWYSARYATVAEHLRAGSRQLSYAVHSMRCDVTRP